MVFQWLSGCTLAFKWTRFELDWLSDYPLVIRLLEWYSNGYVVVYWHPSGTGLELDWLRDYPQVIKLLEWYSNG